MMLIGFWLALGGYLLIYWGQYMLRGKHVDMKTLALG